MFRYHRTSRAKTGKFLDAARWAKEVVEHINTNYEPISVQAYIERFGDISAVHWYADFEDLASFERVNAQLQADQGYQALITKTVDLFIDGSQSDTLYQSI